MRYLSLACLLVCGQIGCKVDLQRMLAQRRANLSSNHPQRLALMAKASPAGTVSHNQGLEPQLDDGCRGTSYVTAIPIAETTALLDLGRRRFQTFCAACHGPSGDGNSKVAQAMERTRPKSFLAPPVRDYPPGRVFRTVTLGYKLMPAYRDDLGAVERWAVTAYVKSLSPETAAHSTLSPSDDPGPTCTGEAP